jgi:hypothetical protein
MQDVEIQDMYQARGSRKAGLVAHPCCFAIFPSLGTLSLLTTPVCKLQFSVMLSDLSDAFMHVNVRQCA